MARVRARAVHLHGINTLYHAVSVYTGMHKTLETLETLALRARVSKPVSAVLYIPVYTSTAWYNLYILDIEILHMYMYVLRTTCTCTVCVHVHEKSVIETRQMQATTPEDNSLFSREKEELPRAGLEPAIFCVLGRCCTS